MQVFLLLSLVAMSRTALAGIPPVSCSTVLSQECWDEPRSVCNTVQKPVTSVTFDQKCTTVSDQVCNTLVDSVVELVPRQECVSLTDQKCTKVPKQDCTTIQVAKTTTFPEQKCFDRLEEICVPVQRQHCDTVQDKINKQVMQKNWFLLSFHTREIMSTCC